MFRTIGKSPASLNVNIGLRYEFQTPLTERYNRTVRGFDPNATFPFATQAQTTYALNPTPEVPAAQFVARGGLTFAGVNGQPRGAYNPEKNGIHAARRICLQSQ